MSLAMMSTTGVGWPPNPIGLEGLRKRGILDIDIHTGRVLS